MVASREQRTRVKGRPCGNAEVYELHEPAWRVRPVGDCFVRVLQLQPAPLQAFLQADYVGFATQQLPQGDGPSIVGRMWYRCQSKEV